MTIIMRYENTFKSFDITNEEAGVWAKNLGISDYDTFSDKQTQLQEKVDELFNKPEYNNMHKFYRHKGYIPDYLRDSITEYDNTLTLSIKHCTLRNYLRRHFAKRPHYADTLISCYLDDVSIDAYATHTHRDRTTISRRCQKALKLLKTDRTYKFLHELGGFVVI